MDMDMGPGHRCPPGYYNPNDPTPRMDSMDSIERRRPPGMDMGMDSMDMGMGPGPGEECYKDFCADEPCQNGGFCVNAPPTEPGPPPPPG